MRPDGIKPKSELIPKPAAGRPPDNRAPGHITPRVAAVKAYQMWRARMTRAESVAERFLSRNRWEPRDRGLFLEMFYGVVRRHGQLEWLIGRISTRGAATADPTDQAAVIVALYQLLFLDRIPAFSAVNEAVEMVRRRSGSSVAGWANAVLRSVADDPEQYRSAAPKGDELTRLSTVHAHPRWLVDRWARLLPDEQLETFLIHNNRRPHLTARVNLHRTTAAEIITKFTAVGVPAVVVERFPWMVRLEHTGDPAELEPLAGGLMSIQDISQSLVAPLVCPLPGETILDLCAAPGGKSCHLAELAPEAHILATDKSPERLDLVRDNAIRIGLSNLKVLPFDTVLGGRGGYDAVLVDAPCTGTGVLARRPDLRWRLRPVDARRMASVQLQLLQYAAERVRPGGRLVYSTCSVEPTENSEVVDEFLTRNPQFRRVRGGALPDDLFDERGEVNLLGPEINADGVFAVRMERRA